MAAALVTLQVSRFQRAVCELLHYAAIKWSSKFELHERSPEGRPGYGRTQLLLWHWTIKWLLLSVLPGGFLVQSQVCYCYNKEQ